MRLHSKKTIINYAPEGSPPKIEKNRINISLYIYLVILTILVFYMFYVFYTKILYVKFVGFVEIPKIVVKAYTDETVDKILVKKGSVVKVGQPLFSVKHPFETRLPVTVRLNLETQLDNLKTKLKTVRISLKRINSQEIIRIDNQIESIKAQLISKESFLKTLNNLIKANWALEKNNRLLELSTLNPNAFANAKLNIQNIKATIAFLKASLWGLKKERRGLVELVRNDLLSKENLLKNNIAILENELNKLNSQVVKTEISDVVRSQLNGRVVEINVYSHQGVAKGDSLAVIVPHTKNTRILLYSGIKKLKYLKKGLKLNLILSNDIVLHGKLIDIHSVALKYQPKLSKDYWPLESPVVGVVELINPPNDLISLDGVKVKAVIGRKVWSIF